MESNYKKLGNFIAEIDIRNTDSSLGENDLYGLSVYKEFITTHANLVGVKFDGYKVVKPKQFTYIPDTSRRGDKIAVAMNTFEKRIIVSNVYTVFEVVKPDELLPDFLMLLFKNPEFDRYARYNSWGSAREVFSWNDFCATDLYIPDINEQKKIVSRYKTITNHIILLERLNNKLEAIQKLIYLNIMNNYENQMQTRNINEIFHIVYGKGLASENLKQSGYEVYGGNGVIGYNDVCTYKEPQIIISCRGAASGKVIITNSNSFVTSNSLVLELSNYNLFEFYKQHFLLNQFYEYVTGSAQPQLTIDNLAQCNIPFFDYSIIEKELNQLCILSKMINNYKRIINELNKLKALIIG